MEVGQKRDVLMVILLSFVTCGIYGLWWVYTVGKEVNNALGREEVNPMYFWLGIFCFPVYYLYLYKLDLAIVELGQDKDVPYTSNFVIWLICSFLAGVGIIICQIQVQSFLNQLWDKQA